MALQLKYNLISRKWWFKLLPLDVPFCIAKVTPLYVECDHTGLYQFLIIHWSTVLIACRFSCALQNKQNTPLNNVSDHIYGLIVWVWSLTLFKGMFRFSFAQNEFSLLAAIAYFIVKREWDRKGADRISSTESEIKRVQKGYHQVVCRQGWHLGGAVSRAMMLSEGKCIQQCTLIGLQSNTM